MLSIICKIEIDLLLPKWDPRGIIYNNTTIVLRPNGTPITMFRPSDTPIPTIDNCLKFEDFSYTAIRLTCI